MNSRITDPQKIPSSSKFTKLPNFRLPTIQFSKRGYSVRQLKKVNVLCKMFGAKLEVRFYGHYGEAFDASVLKYLPDVRWLSVDCLKRIDNIEYLYKLRSLNKLSFGVFDFDDPRLLFKLDLNDLMELRLSDNKKKNIDLAPLSDALKLKNLGVVGHTKNISSLSESKTIESLRLGSIAKRQDLAFVSDITNLLDLEILLGGRETINEIQHSKLLKLDIIRVRGFKDIGEMTRFPQLKKLRIEDQIQLKSFSLRNLDLRTLFVHNCKNLNKIEYLTSQKNLIEFRTYRTNLDLERMTLFEWPQSLEILALYSGQSRRDTDIRRKLDSLGYREFS